jgi:NTE family protein
LVLGTLSPVHFGRVVAGRLRSTFASGRPLATSTRFVNHRAETRPIGRQPVRNGTDVLADLLARRAFGDMTMSEVTRAGVATVLSAADLITARAVRFGSANSSSSVHGRIVEPIRVADAVAASAAYPVLLPPMQRTFTFERGGQQRRAPVTLTDGGVYDNLGLSVLEPGRSATYTGHAYQPDFIVACDAGRQEQGTSTARMWPRRLIRSFDITYRKTQDGSRARLHNARRAGQLNGFVHAYLGMRDQRLPMPIPGLVPLARVNTYPTNFAAMSEADLAAVAVRGEQLTRALLQHYVPQLLC